MNWHVLEKELDFQFVCELVYTRKPGKLLQYKKIGKTFFIYLGTI